MEDERASYPSLSRVPIPTGTTVEKSQQAEYSVNMVLKVVRTLLWCIIRDEAQGDKEMVVVRDRETGRGNGRERKTESRFPLRK